MQLTQCSLPLRNHSLKHQPLKLYSLFRKVDNHWVRVSDCSYSEKRAYLVFTERMMEDINKFSIRPIKTESLSAR